MAIRTLIAGFNHLFDQRRSNEFAATFTPNGVLEIPGGRFEGRAAPAAYVVDTALGEPVDIGFGLTGRLGTTVHATTDNVITIDGDQATQLSYMLVFRQAPRDAAPDGLLVITERFEDRLARTDAGWLFERRTMTILRTNAEHDTTRQKAGHPPAR